MQIDATTRDSDFSGNDARLTGAASLCVRLGFAPIARDLPAYLGLTFRRAVHADPAGALRGRWLLSNPLTAAFAQQRGARLITGFWSIEAH